MSNFSIDDEIDKLTEQFKVKLKKLILRSEKIVLKQYIASQKESAHNTKFRGNRINNNSNQNTSNKKIYKKNLSKKNPKREKEYNVSSSSENDLSETESE